MSYYCIEKKRINSLNAIASFDYNKIQLGIPVETDEASVVGLSIVGDTVLPSAKFGVNCNRNAYGDSYIDKSKEKEYRYVSTNWIRPYGNDNADKIAVDVCRNCFPKIEVEAYGIELQLYEDGNNKQFVIINMTNTIREKYIKEAINLMLEIYGKCYVFDDEIQIETMNERRRCNWEILPPGEMPSRHIERQLRNQNKKTDSFDVSRLEYIEKYGASIIVEGINGFSGYFAFLFDSYCVLETVIYGNATYIIPQENWEETSQKTKQELVDEKIVINKIIHNMNWKNNMTKAFKDLGIISK